MTDVETKGLDPAGPQVDPVANSFLDICAVLEACSNAMPALKTPAVMGAIAGIRQRWSLAQE